MEKVWFYSHGASTEKQGPVSDREIRNLIAGGKLHPDDPVWTEGMSEWLPLRSVPELLSELTMETVDMHELVEELRRWIAFVGVMTIVIGSLQCLTCVGALFGVPMIISGVALLRAKGAIASVTVSNPAVTLTLAKLKTFFFTQGLIYIVGIVITLIALLIVLFLGAGMLSAVGR